MLLAPAEVVGDPVAKVGDPEELERTVEPAPNLTSLETTVLHPPRDLIGHDQVEELVLRVLGHRPDVGGDPGQRRFPGVGPEDVNVSGELPGYEMRDDPGADV